MKFIFFSLFILPAIAQGASSFSEVLRSMKPVDSMSVLETKVQDPLYRDLQFQVRTAGHDRYELGGAGRMALKVNLLAWGQREKEIELNREYEKLSATLNTEGSGSECFYRGLLWSNAYSDVLKSRIHSRLQNYYEDEVRILKRGIGENLFEFKELLTVKEEEVKNRLALSEVKTRLAAIESSLALRRESEVKVTEVDFSSFISVAGMKTVVSAKEPRQIELEKLQQLAHIHSLELEIEKKEAQQILDNIELYRWNDNRNYGISYGIQVTFNIPFLNKRTYMKDAVQRQVAANKFAERQRDLLSKTGGTRNGFENKVAQYEELANSDYFKVLKEMRKLLSASRNNSPLMILQTKIKIAKEKLKRLELRQEITVQYLENLLYSGKLTSCDEAQFLVER